MSFYFILSHACLLQYQRWLYPVDKNRVDDGIGEFTQNDENQDQTNSKKNK